MEAIPATVHEGMKVCDRSMDDIGTVETFRLSDEDPTRPGPETASGSPVVQRTENDLVAMLADVFTPDDGLPRQLQEKALREGFVRLDADGLFAADRYIFPEHIDRVEGDRLVLSVRKDDLIKV
jgi:hypothetical protein